MPLFLSRFEYRLTCYFKRYCLLFLDTTALTPVPVFRSALIGGDSADLIKPKYPETWTVLTFLERLCNAPFRMV